MSINTDSINLIEERENSTMQNLLRWLERVLVFFDALYLGVKIFRLELANHDHILPQNNDNIKVSIFCRFLKKFVAMATQLGFEI